MPEICKRDLLKLEGGELQYNCKITEQHDPSVVKLGLFESLALLKVLQLILNKSSKNACKGLRLSAEE